jgi:hypothetical protein
VASFLFVVVLKPASPAIGALLAAWLALPYVILALVVKSGKERNAAIASAFTSALVSAGGLLFLTDIILLRPDPQGGIAVLFTPIYQILGLLVLLPACRQLAAKRLRQHKDGSSPENAEQ